MWVINPAVGCHYFPSGLQLPPQPLRGLLPVLLLGEQRHNGCEQFAYDCYPTASRLRFELGPFCAWVQHANHLATEPPRICDWSISAPLPQSDDVCRACCLNGCDPMGASFLRCQFRQFWNRQQCLVELHEFGSLICKRATEIVTIWVPVVVRLLANCYTLSAYLLMLKPRLKI